MDPSPYSSSEHVSLAQKTKHLVKGSTLKSHGITKSTAIKKHPMAAAMHRFAADPKKNSREKGLKTLELIQKSTHPTTLSASSADEKFPFQQIETPATVAQSYTSTVSTSPCSTTNTSPFLMDSTVPAPALCSFTSLDSPLHSLCSSTPIGHSVTSFISATQGFSNDAPVVQSWNGSTPWSSAYSHCNTTSQPLIQLFPLSKNPLTRKRSSDALQVSEPKRQKIGPSNSLNKGSADHLGRSTPVMEPRSTQALGDYVSNAAARTQGSSSYKLGAEELHSSLPAPTRGFNISSLLNPQEVLHDRSHMTIEPSENNSASFVTGDHVPLTASTLEATPAVSVVGEDNTHSQAASPLGQTDTENLPSPNHIPFLTPSFEPPPVCPTSGSDYEYAVNHSHGAMPSNRLNLPESTHISTISGAHVSPFTSCSQNTPALILGDEGAATTKHHAPSKQTPGEHVVQQSHIPSTNLVNESQTPTTTQSQGPSHSLGDEDARILANNSHNTSTSNRLGNIKKKRKYEAGKETRVETGPKPKRAKPETIRTAPAQKSKGGRPRNPPKLPIVRTSLPTLTSKNPVKDFPMDLWNMVFGFATPKFLLKAQRVNKLFNLALQYTKSWESARRTTYPDCPDPPHGMSEREYAFHLEGAGCQAVMKDENGEDGGNGDNGRNGGSDGNDENGEDGKSGEAIRKVDKCPNKCRKTYWAFEKKWCAKHLKERLMSSREVQNIEFEYPDLRRLLPSASFDSWDTYLCAGNHTARPAWLRCLPYKTQYLKEDVEKIRQEYGRIRTRTDGTAASPEEITAWINAKSAEVDSKVKKRQEIETWVETRNKAELEKHRDFTQAKKEFYKTKAMAMDPPLEFEALAHTQSYINAIAIKKEPSERSWQILEDKLKKERYYAEEIVRLDREIQRRGVPPDDFLGFGPRGVENEMTGEGMLVRGLVQSQIAAVSYDFLNAAETNEWIPRILREFYDAFEALPYDQKLNDDGNDIRLTMYHAKVVAEMVEAHFQVTRGNPIPTYLTVKCPLCPHKGNSTTRSFDRHVTHIGEKHARNHEGFAEWRMFPNRSFPWMRVPWPKSLPVLRNSDTSPGKWNLGRMKGGTEGFGVELGR